MNKIEQWMNSRIGLNFRSGLDRMEQAVSLLGRPDKAYPILHVTGTNGESSLKVSSSTISSLDSAAWALKESAIPEE